MNICVCSSCSKKILVSKVLDNKCYACGTRCNVDIENSGTYLEGVIEECEKELFAQKYSRAMELYDKYIELFPNISTLYWGRFMASNSSCNVEQLLKQGIPFEESSDYQVAISSIFLITKHYINCSFTPLFFPSRRKNSPFF